MPSVRSQNELGKKTLLLREVVELLMWELSAISNRKWEDLPALKAKKETLASRLREFDWTPGPIDLEPLDLIMLKSQISDLEYQSKQKVQVHLQRIKGQIDALQGQQQSWLECINFYSRQAVQPVSTP
jgi:hypothetical protein